MFSTVERSLKMVAFYYNLLETDEISFIGGETQSLQFLLRIYNIPTPLRRITTYGTTCRNLKYPRVRLLDKHSGEEGANSIYHKEVINNIMAENDFSDDSKT